MEGLSKEEKIKFIENQGLSVYNGSDIEFLFNIARVKEMVKISCFGHRKDDSPICDDCYLSKQECGQYTDYSNKAELESKSLLINKKLYPIEDLLSRFKFRSGNNKAYKITKMILTSHGQDYSELIENIRVLCNLSTLKQARCRFYIYKSKIEKAIPNLKILFKKRKIVSLSGD